MKLYCFFRMAKFEMSVMDVLIFKMIMQTREVYYCGLIKGATFFFFLHANYCEGKYEQIPKSVFEESTEFKYTRKSTEVTSNTALDKLPSGELLSDSILRVQSSFFLKATMWGAAVQ